VHFDDEEEQNQISPSAKKQENKPKRPLKRSISAKNNGPMAKKRSKMAAKNREETDSSDEDKEDSDSDDGMNEEECKFFTHFIMNIRAFNF
jgi:hypothetical protein